MSSTPDQHGSSSNAGRSIEVLLQLKLWDGSRTLSISLLKFKVGHPDLEASRQLANNVEGQLEVMPWLDAVRFPLVRFCELCSILLGFVPSSCACTPASTQPWQWTEDHDDDAGDGHTCRLRFDTRLEFINEKDGKRFEPCHGRHTLASMPFTGIRIVVSVSSLKTLVQIRRQLPNWLASDARLDLDGSAAVQLGDKRQLEQDLRSQQPATDTAQAASSKRGRIAGRSGRSTSSNRPGTPWSTGSRAPSPASGEDPPRRSAATRRVAKFRTDVVGYPARPCVITAARTMVEGAHIVPLAQCAGLNTLAKRLLDQRPDADPNAAHSWLLDKHHAAHSWLLDEHHVALLRTATSRPNALALFDFRFPGFPFAGANAEENGLPLEVHVHRLFDRHHFMILQGQVILLKEPVFRPLDNARFHPVPHAPSTELEAAQRLAHGTWLWRGELSSDMPHLEPVTLVRSVAQWARLHLVSAWHFYVAYTRRDALHKLGALLDDALARSDADAHPLQSAAPGASQAANPSVPPQQPGQEAQQQPPPPPPTSNPRPTSSCDASHHAPPSLEPIEPRPVDAFLSSSSPDTPFSTLPTSSSSQSSGGDAKPFQAFVKGFQGHQQEQSQQGGSFCSAHCYTDAPYDADDDDNGSYSSQGYFLHPNEAREQEQGVREEQTLMLWTAFQFLAIDATEF